MDGLLSAQPQRPELPRARDRQVRFPIRKPNWTLGVVVRRIGWSANVGAPGVIAAALALSAPVVAQATPWTGSGTIAPTTPAPTFQDPNPVTPPVIPYAVSYDPTSGTLSISVGGGPNTSNIDDSGNTYTGWFPLELYFSGPHIGQLDNGYLDVSTATLPTGSGNLFDPGPGSTSSTSVTESADGQTLTTMFTSQLLANIDDNFVSVNNIYAVPASFYLSGNGPYTSASVNGSHSIAADTPFTDSNPAATLSASLENLAETDVNSEETGGQLQENYFPDLNPPSYGTTGLPPGLRLDSAGAAIVGMPTKPGHYNSTITATTYYVLRTRRKTVVQHHGQLRLDRHATTHPRGA